MQTEQQLFTNIEKAVSSVLNTKPGEITMDSKFRGDLGAESIDMIDISFEIEKTTGKELDFKQIAASLQQTQGSEVKDLKIGDLVTYLQKMDA